MEGNWLCEESIEVPAQIIEPYEQSNQLQADERLSYEKAGLLIDRFLKEGSQLNE